MPIELKVPSVGESITEVQVGQWLKGEGEWADKDQPLVEIESDKATVELLAPQAGTVARVLKDQGQTANVGEVIGYLEASQAPAKDRHQPDAQARDRHQPDAQARKPQPDSKGKDQHQPDAQARDSSAKNRHQPDAQARDSSAAQPAPEQPAAELQRAQQELRPAGKDSARQEPRPETPPGEPRGEPAPAETPPPAAERKDDREAQRPAHIMPAARRALAEHGLQADQVEASGPGGRLLKEDVERHVERSGDGRQAQAGEQAKRQPEAATDRDDEVLPMSPLRKRVAERLVQAQRIAALLTTFNEIDMSAVMSLRQQHKESFQEKYGVKLGIMSFFVKATIEALKETPQVNAEIRGTDIVYHNYFDIGIAVAGGKGLVVPVLRAADRMSFAEIEQVIADLAGRARQNKLKLHELDGGTFTISNGGVYGSLLSTPIVNPPQSGILGLHAVQDRPVARDGQVVIRPMMYVALTYDHRLVDGREAVLFLRHIKDCIEEPSRMLLEV